MNKKIKVAVGMSGGVDSSIAAYLLQQQGYHVVGIFMKNWEEEDTHQHCAAAQDLLDAQSVCDTLNIELFTINFSAEYWENVFTHFLHAYQAGITPNPDILCNKEIKFKHFLQFAIDDLGNDFIATGHYVRCQKNDHQYQLLRGIDSNKDQSYFVYTLTQAQLEKTRFPIGELTKPQVRQLANKLHLKTANKKDSTGICFIGAKNFRPFMQRYLPARLGAIVTIDGEIIGEHQGIMYYTLGQRQGLGIGGLKNNHNSAAWYVVDKNMKTNELIVAQGDRHPRLLSTGLIGSDIHWIDNKPLVQKKACSIKTRYRQNDVRCTLSPLKDGKILVEFDEPIAAVTPGQAAVFYQNEYCLGGATIEARLPFSE